jgi:hypothetical protein
VNGCYENFFLSFLGGEDVRLPCANPKLHCSILVAPPEGHELQAHNQQNCPHSEAGHILAQIVLRLLALTSHTPGPDKSQPWIP